MHLDKLLLRDFLVDQKLSHIFALVSLELDDIPEFRVFHNRSVAVELLLALFQDDLLVDFGINPL